MEDKKYDNYICEVFTTFVSDKWKDEPFSISCGLLGRWWEIDGEDNSLEIAVALAMHTGLIDLNKKEIKSWVYNG